MRNPYSVTAVSFMALLSFVAIAAWSLHTPSTAATPPAATAKPALSVAVVSPQPALLSVRIAANGNVMAWQEASVGTEANGLRLAQVRVNVGDVVRRGQVLAVFSADTVTAELARSRADVAEAEANLAEARANAARAHGLAETGALSAQQIQRYATAEQTAASRLTAMQAVEKSQQTQLARSQVLAPDDGVISSRTATVGAVLPAGEELFRLIRGGRLEWRAEVSASELSKLKPGQVAQVTAVGGQPVAGRVRMVAPTVDTQTRNGLVYVDLPADTSARAGMFARGEFHIGESRVLTLPHSAVVLRDGHAQVMQVDAQSKITQTQVTAGRREGDRIEITGGIDASARVVASGGAFLGDGDLVREVAAANGSAR